MTSTHNRKPSWPARVKTVFLGSNAPNDWEGLLEPGERLLWTGAPAQGLRWRRKDWVLTLVTALWTGLVITLLMRDHQEWLQGERFEPGKLAIVIGFLFVGLYLTIGRFFWDSSVRARSRYALTNQRGLIAVTSGRKRLTFLPLHIGMEVSVERPEGSLLLLGEVDSRMTAAGAPNPRPTRRTQKFRNFRHKLSFAFIGAEEAERVQKLAQQAIAALEAEQADAED